LRPAAHVRSTGAACFKRRGLSVSRPSDREIASRPDYPKLDALYKDIHANPEIAFQEDEDRRKLALRCARSVRRSPRRFGKTACVAIYKNG